MKSPVTLVRAFLNDIKRLDSSVQGLDRDFITIERRFEHEGISFLTNTLVTICDSLDQGLENGTFDCPTSFAKKKSSALPKFLWGLLSNVFDSSGTLKPFPCVHSIKSIRELCRMFKKFSLSTDAISVLERKTMSSFLEVDSNLSFDPNERMVHLFKKVSKLVLGNSSYEDYSQSPIFKHGPGSTVETSDVNQKWNILYKELFHPDKHLPIGFDSHNYGPIGVSTLPSVDSKLICVPKTSMSLRTISVERVLNQFIQQQLNDFLRKSIRRCSVLSLCLDLNDQSHNQILAMSGSHTRSVATIDLSKASDRLSIDLVKLAFEQNNPVFLQDLLLSRAKNIKVNDKTHNLNKFAGMGNATTFPVQSICYAILCIAAQHDIDGIKPTMNSCRRYAREIRIFGDDLIIKNSSFHQTTIWLEEFGLKVNHLKSFHKGNFRESCGCDAYNGVDVTPVYIRTLPTKALHTPSTLAAAVSASNSFWERGLYCVATTISDMCSKYLNLPLVSKNSGILGLVSRIDTMEAHSWDSKHQCLITKGSILSSIKKASTPISPGAALLKCLVSSFESRMDPLHLSRYSKRYSTRLRKAWVPTYVGY